MKTDIIEVCSDLRGKEAAMDAAERFAAYNRLTGKNAMHLRLLTEESVCMIHGIIDDFKGDFWIESRSVKDGLLCRICVLAKKSVSDDQEEMILSVSTSGKNESAKGILGKIREIIRWSVQTSDDENFRDMHNMADAWWGMGIHTNEMAQNMDKSSDYWSLRQYRENLAAVQENTDAEWDELEKSIIAKLADEVKVWLRSDSTEVVIEKLFRI